MSNDKRPMYICLGFVTFFNQKKKKKKDLFHFQIRPFHVRESRKLVVGGDPNLIFFARKRLSLRRKPNNSHCSEQKFLVIYCWCCLVHHLIMAGIVHKVGRAMSTVFKRMERMKNGQKDDWRRHLEILRIMWSIFYSTSTSQNFCHIKFYIL